MKVFYNEPTASLTIELETFNEVRVMSILASQVNRHTFNPTDELGQPLNKTDVADLDKLGMDIVSALSQIVVSTDHRGTVREI